MNYQESLDYLYQLGHETLAIKLGLNNMQTLLAAFFNPHQSFLKIQIVGTNGKGSVCAFLDSICRGADLKTGLYTSPHLVSITERIKVNGSEISPQKFAELTTRVRETAYELIQTKQLAALPTFFEHLTIIALLFFQEAGVDVAILETGLGGRLDATTAARAEIIGITPISRDHQEYLGNTLAEIAAEKAAVIRAETKVVIAPQEPEAMQIVIGQCQRKNVRPVTIKKNDFQVNETTGGRINATFTTSNAAYRNISPSLLGRHQLENAAVAINLAELLQDFNLKISSADIGLGLKTAQHAGRLEFWRDEQPPILFDGAHNLAGAKALKIYLQEFFGQTPLTFIFGAMRDKDLAEITAEVFPHAKKLILTKVDNPRSATSEDLFQYVKAKQKNVMLTATVSEALSLARRVTEADNLIIVTGSLYLVGEVQRILSSRELKRST